MHEVSLAEAVLTTALDAAERHGGGRVTALTVRAGALQNVVVVSLQMAFRAVSAGTLAEGAELTVEVEPVTARCRRCGLEFAVEEAVFACPRCAVADVETLSGTELYLMSLELEPCE